MCIYTCCDHVVHFSVDVFFLQKERKLLQNKRLDLDAAKNRLKKARMADARSAVSITHTHTNRIQCSAIFYYFKQMFRFNFYSLFETVERRNSNSKRWIFFFCDGCLSCLMPLIQVCINVFSRVLASNLCCFPSSLSLYFWSLCLPASVCRSWTQPLRWERSMWLTFLTC